MEMGLDVVLFTRSTRSIELTESGRYLFRKATDLLNDFHAIKRSIDTIAQGIEARVRICINQLLYTPQHTGAAAAGTQETVSNLPDNRHHRGV